MEYANYKIYDSEVCKIVTGFRVADCMILDNADENMEKCTYFL